jgi:type IV pilus assembly protein PilX
MNKTPCPARHGAHVVDLNACPTARGLTPQRRRGRGVSMIVVLALLVLMSSAAIFSARYATMGESMARNQLDYERARQAAESALRDAERDLRLPGSPAAMPTGAVCDRGVTRPVDQNLNTASFTADCMGGQCMSDPALITASDWTDTALAEPWWPVARGGRWARNKEPTAGCDFTGAVPLGK